MDLKALVAQVVASNHIMEFEEFEEFAGHIDHTVDIVEVDRFLMAYQIAIVPFVLIHLDNPNG